MSTHQTNILYMYHYMFYRYTTIVMIVCSIQGCQSFTEIRVFLPRNNPELRLNLRRNFWYYVDIIHNVPGLTHTQVYHKMYDFLFYDFPVDDPTWHPYVALQPFWLFEWQCFVWIPIACRPHRGCAPPPPPLQYIAFKSACHWGQPAGVPTGDSWAKLYVQTPVGVQYVRVNDSRWSLFAGRERRDNGPPVTRRLGSRPVTPTPGQHHVGR